MRQGWAFRTTKCLCHDLGAGVPGKFAASHSWSVLERRTTLIVTHSPVSQFTRASCMWCWHKVSHAHRQPDLRGQKQSREFMINWLVTRVPR